MPKAKQVDDAFIDIGERVVAQLDTVSRQLGRLLDPPLPPHIGEQKEPRRMNMQTFVSAVPGLFSEWDGLRRPVPEDFVSVDADEEGAPIAVIACPCGESPVVPHLGIRTCNCRRVFASIGRGEIRAWRPPPLTDEEYDVE